MDTVQRCFDRTVLDDTVMTLISGSCALVGAHRESAAERRRHCTLRSSNAPVDEQARVSDSDRITRHRAGAAS